MSIEKNIQTVKDFFAAIGRRFRVFRGARSALFHWPPYVQGDVPAGSPAAPTTTA